MTKEIIRARTEVGVGISDTKGPILPESSHITSIMSKHPISEIKRSKNRKLNGKRI